MSALSFTDLPTELVGQVCTHLEKNDLLSFRLVSKYCEKVTVTELSRLLARHLKNVSVLLTPDAIKVFQGLCQAPEFRNKMRTVSLMPPWDPYACYTDYKAHCFPHWMNLTEEEYDFLRDLSDSHKSYMQISSAVEDLSETFHLLQSFVNLREVYLGGFRYRGGDMTTIRGMCGVRDLRRFKKITHRAIKLHHFTTINDPKSTYQTVLHSMTFSCSFQTVLRALDASGFDRKVVTMALWDDKDAAKCDKASLRFEISPMWRSITGKAQEDHLPSPEDSAGRLLRRISIYYEGRLSHTAVEYLKPANQLETLRLNAGHPWPWIGNGADPSTGTAAICGILTKQDFPHLSKVQLVGQTINVHNLAAVFAKYSGTLKIVEIKHAYLTQGTWKSIFQIFWDMPSLSHLSLSDLCEPVSKVLPPSTNLSPSKFTSLEVITRESVIHAMQATVLAFATHKLPPGRLNSMIRAQYALVSFPLCLCRDHFRHLLSGKLPIPAEEDMYFAKDVSSVGLLRRDGDRPMVIRPPGFNTACTVFGSLALGFLFFDRPRR